MKLEREKWPINREFRRDAVPREELRSKHEVLSLMDQLKTAVRYSGLLCKLIQKNIEYHESWNKSLGVLARVIRSLSGFDPTLSNEERRKLII